MNVYFSHEPIVLRHTLSRTHTRQKEQEKIIARQFKCYEAHRPTDRTV